MDEHCKGAFNVPRCHFEARYDFSEPLLPERLTSVTGYDLREFRRETYVCDICTTCGKVVDRPKKESK